MEKQNEQVLVCDPGPGMTENRRAAGREENRRIRLTEIAENAFLLRLKPEASFLYGPVYLRKTNPDMQIFVNLLPVLPDKDGVFRVYPGSVIELK